MRGRLYGRLYGRARVCIHLNRRKRTFCFVEALFVFLLWIRIGDDASSCVHKYLSVLFVYEANTDAGVHVSIKIDISDGAPVDTCLLYTSDAADDIALV